MSDVFNLDYSHLTDEQLSEKQTAVYNRLGWAQSNSSSGLMGNLLAHLEAIEVEINFRASKAYMDKIIEITPALIETDPDLAAQNKQAAGDLAAPAVVERKPKHRSKKSARPINPNSINEDLDD